MGEKAIHTELIRSAVYGEITVTREQIYTFHQGLIGLSHITEYALLPYDNSDLFILQGCHEDISFILVPAAKVELELAFHLDEETVDLLDASNAEEVVPFYIVHVVDNSPHVNAKAPILIVPSAQKGCQYVINDGNYSVREPLVMKEQPHAST